MDKNPPGVLFFRQFLSLTIVLTACITGFSQAAPDWKVIDEDDNIIMYRRNAPDTVKDFIADFTLFTSLSNTESYITNPIKYKDWINSLEEIDKIRTINATTEVYAFKINVKTLFQRAGILRTERFDDRKEIRYVVELDTTENYTLSHPRVNYVRLIWELKALKEDEIKVRMHYYGITRKYNILITPIVDMFYEMAVQNLARDLRKEIMVN